MTKKNNIGLGLAALAVGAGAVAAVTKGHKAEVKRRRERQPSRQPRKTTATPSLEDTTRTAKASIIPTVTTRPSQDLRSQQEWMRRMLTS